MTSQFKDPLDLQAPPQRLTEPRSGEGGVGGASSPRIWKHHCSISLVKLEGTMNAPKQLRVRFYSPFL